MCRVIERTPGLVLAAEASSAATAIAKITQHRPDVAVIDLRLDKVDHDGIRVAEESAKASPGTKFVFVTELESAASVTAAVQARVPPATFMRKADLTDPERLREIVVMAANGTISFSPRAAEQVIARIRAADPVEKYGFTTREREVAALLADGKTNDEIAKTLVIQNQSARRHVSKVIGKLGTSNRTTAALLAKELGLGTRTPRDQ